MMLWTEGVTPHINIIRYDEIALLYVWRVDITIMPYSELDVKHIPIYVSNSLNLVDFVYYAISGIGNSVNQYCRLCIPMI